MLALFSGGFVLASSLEEEEGWTGWSGTDMVFGRHSMPMSLPARLAFPTTFNSLPAPLSISLSLSEGRKGGEGKTYTVI